MSEKNSIELEYVFKASPGILFPCLVTASGLAEWFADHVQVQRDIYTFTWENYSQQAQLLKIKNEIYAKFLWLDGDNQDCAFKFEISTDEMSNDTILRINDYTDDPEPKDIIQLWDKQIAKLRRAIGG